MSTKFNPLAKKGFDKIGDTAGLVSDTAYGASWDGVTDVAPSKNAVYDKIQTLAGGHDAVTLDANADTLLSLSTQELGLDTQGANTIFAGPASGADAVPTFRALVADDIPDLSGTYLTAETDPDFNAWLLATPPLYPGGWYDAVQNTIGLSGFDNDSGFITSFDDEKVKYDAGDPTAGYVADKIIAGTGISVAEGTGANENKLVVTSDITQYTDSDAIAAIQGDASWNASDWDTAYGWGNHASAGYLTSVTAHDLLSATHGDTTASAVARGDLIVGTGATPKWDNLAIGTAGKVLQSDGTDVAWSTNALTIGASASVSGSNTGDQIIPDNEAGAANNFLTAYNSATGAWTKARPTWANIDKTTSDIADLTTKSHTSLTDIGTLTHATIDSYLDQAVKTTSSPTFAGMTVNGATITLSRDTNFVLSGGVNGVSFDTNVLSIDATNDRVGIGTTAPPSPLTVWGSGIEATRFNAAAGGAYLILSHSYHNTSGSYGYLPVDNEVGKVMGQAWNGTSMSTCAGIYLLADQTHASGKIGTRMEFRVTPNDSTAAPTTALTIDSNGYIGLGLTAPGARLQFAGGTTAAGGILFGADTNLYRSAANTLKTDDAFQAASYAVGTTAGANGTFTTADSKTVTVTGGIITSIV